MNINKLFQAPAKPSAWLVLAMLAAPQSAAFADDSISHDAKPAPAIKTASQIAEEQEAEEQREKLARFKAEYLIKQVENKRINSEIELLKNKITKKKLEQDLQKLDGEVIFNAPTKPQSFFSPVVEAVEKPLEQVAKIITPKPTYTGNSNQTLAQAPVNEVTVTSFIVAKGNAYADFMVDGEKFTNIGERELFAGGYRFVYQQQKVQVTFAGKTIVVKGLSSELWGL